MENKFEVGKSYMCSSLYGGTIHYVVVERTERQVTMKEQWIAEDTGEDVKEFTKFDIELECGIEKIKVWEYKGHEAWIYANEGR